jgi:hypothetical protein
MRPLPLLAAAALAAGCARAPVTPPRPDDPSGYWPLAVGNTWTWLDQSPTLSPESPGPARTVRIVERTPDGFFRDSTGAELRASGDCVQDRMRRLLCAPFEAGRQWSSVVSVSSTERYEIAGVGESVVVPAGRFEGCVRVRAINRAGSGANHVLEMTYAPGVGPIRIETFAVVEGRAAPQIRAVLSAYQVGK